MNLLISSVFISISVALLLFIVSTAILYAKQSFHFSPRSDPEKRKIEYKISARQKEIQSYLPIIGLSNKGISMDDCPIYVVDDDKIGIVE